MGRRQTDISVLHGRSLILRAPFSETLHSAWGFLFFCSSFLAGFRRGRSSCLDQAPRPRPAKRDRGPLPDNLAFSGVDRSSSQGTHSVPTCRRELGFLAASTESSTRCCDTSAFSGSVSPGVSLLILRPRSHGIALPSVGPWCFSELWLQYSR